MSLFDCGKYQQILELDKGSDPYLNCNLRLPGDPSYNWQSVSIQHNWSVWEDLKLSLFNFGPGREIRTPDFSLPKRTL